MGMTNTVVV
jgi:hypothetical protein